MFYQSLKTEEVKDDFLRVAIFYLFLVKQGDWHTTVPGADKIVEYQTNSFKVVALFSLIESLTELTYKDFYKWLSEQPNDNIFPIENAFKLQNLYDQYKGSFGSIRQCVEFFNRLPHKQKNTLCNSVEFRRIGDDSKPHNYFDKKEQSIEKIVKYLYDLRSKFVHNTKFVLSISNMTVVSKDKNKLIITNLPLPVLLEAFEEGVIAHFKSKTQPGNQPTIAKAYGRVNSDIGDN